MLSEDFDKKIRDAADHHHPTYDENAWKGMKKLLDKHLPEEKDNRRRVIFFLLLFLLLGSGTWYFFGRQSGKRNKETAAAIQPAGHIEADNTVITAQKEAGRPADEAKQNNDDDAITPVAENKSNSGITGQVLPVYPPVTGTGNPNGHTQKKKKQGGITKTVNTAIPADKAGAGKRVNNNPPVEPVVSMRERSADKTGNENKNGNAVIVQTQGDKATTSPVVADKAANTKPAGDKKNDGLTAAQAPVDKKSEEKQADKSDGSAPLTRKEKQVTKRKSSFFISLSAGPDVSSTGRDELGRMKFLVGAGIGYTYKEKFTLRTGFYSARKIYTSSPEEYHAPSYFYTYYPNMQKIDADCKVYEIPVNLSYNFSNNSKQSFFATAGLSTYLMKKETYDYYYKYMPTGPTIHKEYSHYNENKHFFSVLNLGAGYQRNLSKRVSIIAEPYFKLPLKGVGYGKVKLNSGGVLFTLSFKPFQTPKKK
ncbi:MAG: hypothetical protein ACT4OJ_15020 [Bacteroidota bacterium]